MSNPFYMPIEDYQRDLDFMGGALNDAALYLHLQTGDPIDTCRTFVRQQMAFEENKLRNPRTLILNKNDVGDRELKTVNFMQFIGRVKKQNLLISPSLAVYMPEEKRRSSHAMYIEQGVARRGKAKHEMFDAERAGDMDTYLFKKGEQNNLKINNNSYSGATLSTATILYYKSTHSSLTSTCRAATSYANAYNEKFIMGNRHYFSPENVKANLLFIMNNADLALIKSVCDKYGLVYPSSTQVHDMIKSSARNYWRSEEQDAVILKMLEACTPVQLAAVMYVGDMHQLYRLNADAIKKFLFQLAALGRDAEVPDDATFKSYDSDLKLHAMFLCYDQVKGRDLKQIINGDDRANPPLLPDPATYDLVKATALRASRTLMAHEDFIKAFFLNAIMPSAVFEFPNAYRKAVPISDTDSTMFTLQWWVEQIFGKIIFTEESRRVIFSLVFIISECVMHQLGLMSTNMGVAVAKRRMLSMKNEFYFEVLTLANRSKHYSASQDAQEGLMFKKPKMEIKGVGLRDSKVPPKIQRGAKKLMKGITDTIKRGEKISITKILTEIGDLERSIERSLREGETQYLTTGQIRNKSAYKSEDNATYKQYELWRDVFAPSFGHIQEPPYQYVKVSTCVGNRTDMEEWLVKMNNPQLAQRFRDWLVKERKTEITNLLVPYTVIEGRGIPKEITCAIDTRRIISNTMGAFYLKLESLGIFLIDKKNSRLVSDYH